MSSIEDQKVPESVTVVKYINAVAVDELRTGVAETYDVLVEPAEDRAYTLFAETMDRSGYARGTLASRPGMSAAIPARRPRPLRTMEDMGMRMEGMDMGDMKDPHGDVTMHTMKPSGDSPIMTPSDEDQRMPNMTHVQHGAEMQNMPHTPGMDMRDPGRLTMPNTEPVQHGPDHQGPGNQMIAEYSQNRVGGCCAIPI